MRARSLPPLTALRAFDAAARHLNLSRAAAELNVTHGAISRQISYLESFFEIELFKRSPEGVALTDAGRTYAAIVNDAFDRLLAGSETLKSKRQRAVLTVSVLPSFAAHWLVHRLDAFHRDNPDIDVRLSTTWRVVDFGKEDVDVAIRYGMGSWTDCNAELLLKEYLFPVCSPALLASGRKVRGAADLFQFRLLHNMDFTDWERWAAAAGVTSPVFSSDTVYDDYNIILQAAIDGRGVAIGRSNLVINDVATGRLVAPVKERVESERAYYIVTPQHGTRSGPLDRFAAWLRREAAVGA